MVASSALSDRFMSQWGHLIQRSGVEACCTSQSTLSRGTSCSRTAEERRGARRVCLTFDGAAIRSSNGVGVEGAFALVSSRRARSVFGRVVAGLVREDDRKLDFDVRVENFEKHVRAMSPTILLKQPHPAFFRIHLFLYDH